jgi:hypothetical protein
MTIGEMHMAVRRCDINPARLDRLSITRMLGEKRSGAAQNAGQRAPYGAGEVDDYKERTGEVRWKASYQVGQYLDAAGRPTHDYYIPHQH